jgi:hypothetical protein
VEGYGTARQAKDGNEIWRGKYARMQSHSEYVTLISSPRQQCLRQRPSVLRYTYTVCLFVFSNAFNLLSVASGSVRPQAVIWLAFTACDEKFGKVVGL